MGGTHDDGYLERLGHRGGRGQTVSHEKPRKALSLQWVLPGPSIQSPPEAGKELRVPPAYLFTDRGKSEAPGRSRICKAPRRPHLRAPLKNCQGKPYGPGPIAPTVIMEGPQGDSGEQNKLGPALRAHSGKKIICLHKREVAGGRGVS